MDVIETVARMINDPDKLQWGPSRDCITIASFFANNGLLGEVTGLSLENVDLASVPRDQLTSLVSCVSGCLKIINASNIDISRILDHMNCKELYFGKQNLCIEDTKRVVRVMETKIEKLILGGSEGAVILDIMTLTQYSGRGRCGEVTSWYDATDKYKKKILRWAKKINWDITEIDEYLRIRRIPKEKNSFWEPFNLSTLFQSDKNRNNDIKILYPQ